MNHNDIPQNQTEALAYCSTLGMQLAEIKSESQFMALHEADVGEWPENYGNIQILLVWNSQLYKISMF